METVEQQEVVPVSKPVHGASMPKNVPTDMQAVPPITCGFAVGDRVIYTNDYGVTFYKVVRGFVRAPLNDDFVYLNLDCWWSPVTPSALRLVSGGAA